MNVWILNHYATPPDIPGGTRHYDLARELVKRGQKVTIFSSSFDHRTRRDERLTSKQRYRTEDIDGVEFAWLRTFPYYGGNDWRRVMNMLSYACRVISLGLKLKEKPDVILASSPHPFAGLAGWILAKLKGAVFIFEVRDLWPQTFVEIGGYSSKSPVVILLRMLEKFLYHRASKIVVLLPRASNYITGLGIPTGKIVYIPNGVSPDLFSDTSTELPHEMETLISNMKSRGKLLAGYTGAHGIADGLDTIIEAARLLQEKGADKIHFLMVGEGTEKPPLLELARNSKLDNVHFFSPIAKMAMPRLLKTLDLAIVILKKSTLWEYGTSKNKLFEYMICCLPIIWSINSTSNPVADSNCGITVPPEEPQAMAAAIIKLCDLSEDERRQMGRQGYDYVMKYHSIPVLAQKLTEVLQDVRNG